MIQRKQTLFLLAVLLIAIILFFLPFQLLILDSTNTQVLCLISGSNSEAMSSNVYAPMSVNFLVIVIAILTIFQFKNRVLQYKLANLLIIFNVIIIGLFFLLPYVKEGIQGSLHFSIGAFLPIANIIFAFLAAYFIKKDEQLVRSADRIR